MRAKPAVSVTDIADGAILLDETTGVFYHVNQAGALAYQMLQARECSLAEVVTELAYVFGVDESTLSADLEAFFDDLVRQGLVKR